MEAGKHLKERSIVVFESIGGSDKGPDGYRKDTIPIVEAILKHGWHCEVVKFENEKAEEIYKDVVNRFCAYIGRINPGSLPDNEVLFFDTLRKLSSDGMIGIPHPDSMINFGSKLTLVKLNKTGLTPEDTYSYFDIDTFRQNFPTSLSYNERVLKQNRGSIGEGIWRVVVADERYSNHKAGEPLPLDTKLKLTEAFDNHIEYQQLGDFMTFCEKYLIGENGLLVDMRFLPRITEGEIRILMIGATPAFVVHKKPAQHSDAFSSTLFSGAKYRYDSVDQWKPLITFFFGKLPLIKSSLQEKELPLIWSADFILDTNEDMSDKYVLGEINCSCVGFTTHLDLGIQDLLAEEAIRRASSQM